MTKIQIERLILALLILPTSYILLSEMTTVVGFIKALAIEGSILYLSVIAHKIRNKDRLYKALALCMGLFSIYSIISPHLTAAYSTVTEQKILYQRVSSLEENLKSKRLQRDTLLEKEWITAARKLESSIDALEAKLDTLRISTVNTSPVIFNTIAQVILRVLLLVSNILIIQKLVETFAQKKEQEHEKPALITKSAKQKYTLVPTQLDFLGLLA